MIHFSSDTITWRSRVALQVTCSDYFFPDKEGKSCGYKTVVEVTSHVSNLVLTEKKPDAMSWGYAHSNGKFVHVIAI